jgi:hypothetical protein
MLFFDRIPNAEFLKLDIALYRINMSRVDEVPAPTSQRSGGWKTKINLFARPLGIQYFILSLWAIGFILIVFYIVYESVAPNLILAGILPYNLLVLVYIGIGILAVGVGVLIFTATQKSSPTHAGPSD